MNKRIRNLRKSLGLTQQEFADKLGTPRANIANYESSKRLPSEAMVSLICRTFNINEEWLRTGEGEMKASLTREQEIAEIVAVLYKEEDESFRFRLVKAICAMGVEELELWEKRMTELTK